MPKWRAIDIGLGQAANETFCVIDGPFYQIFYFTCLLVWTKIGLDRVCELVYKIAVKEIIYVHCRYMSLVSNDIILMFYTNF